jgi:putative addiction module killer protein
VAGSVGTYPPKTDKFRALDGELNVNYSLRVIEVRQTAVFTDWLARLRDVSAHARVITRIRRMELGNPGDVKPVGEGLSEMRIAYGPGYRLYFTRRGSTVVILLCGGDKSSQRRDIAAAKQMAKEL